MMAIDLFDIRTDFTRNKDLDTLDPNPISQFRYWLQDAIDAGTIDATAFTLATATLTGIPSARILLLKEVDDTGFSFFTSYTSRKARELDDNPIASMLFFWARTERQVRITGKVEKLSESKSDAYFNVRPKESQINAIISPQSEEIPDRSFLEKRRDEFIASNTEISRPKNWGGYCLVPKEIEFWQGGAGRLHHRYVYRKSSNKEWDIITLAP